MATPSWIQNTEKVVGENHISLDDVANRPAKTIHSNFIVEHLASGLHTGPVVLAAANIAANAITVGDDGAKGVKGSIYELQISNLKPVVNADVNKLDIFTKSGGAVPAAAHPIRVSIPDGNGFTIRSRAAAYLSGTSQFIMADAANYWSKGSLDAEIKTAYIYAIWDGTGIVWALGGYSGFTRVPASTTETDDDFFLLEAESTYTKAVTEYCVCVGKIRYQYDTADNPDHTIQATVLDAPQVMWNPMSDYGYQKNLATTNTSAGNIVAYSCLSVVVKQSGKYSVISKMLFYSTGGTTDGRVLIKIGSATYADAVQKSESVFQGLAANVKGSIFACAKLYLTAGDTIHFGAAVSGASGNRVVEGNDLGVGRTSLIFNRID